MAKIGPADAGADAEKAEKRKRIGAMLARMKKLPGVITGSYTRDDIYDRNW